MLAIGLSIYLAATWLAPAAWAEPLVVQVEGETAPEEEVDVPVELEDPGDALDRAAIERALEELQALPKVDGDARRDARVESLVKAIEALDARDKALEQLRRLEVEGQAAPGSTAVIEAKLAQEPAPAERPTATDVGELDKLRAELERTADEARARVAKLEEETRSHSVRRIDVPQEIVEAARVVGELRESGEGRPAADQDPEVAAAAQIRLDAELAASDAQLAALRVEEATLDARRSLSEAGLQLARRNATRAEEELSTALDALSVARKRRAEVDQLAAAEAREAAAMQGRAFSAAAEDTLRLRQETVEITGELDRLRKESEIVRSSAETLTRRFTETTGRVDRSGLTAEVGLRLRQDQRRLFEARATGTGASEIERALTATGVELFDIAVLAEAFQNGDRWVDALVQAAEDEAREEGREAGDVRPLARRLLAEFRSAISAKTEVLDDKYVYLTELDAKRKELDGKLDEYEEFIAERILWIQSSEPVWRINGNNLQAEVRAVASPARWGNAIVAAEKALLGRFDLFLALAFGVGLLFLVRPRLRHALEDEGELAVQRSQVSVMPTLRALLLSVVHSLPLAVAFFALAAFARAVNSDDLFIVALGESCDHSAAAALIIGLVRALTLPKGLGEAHFEWSNEAVALARRQSAWILAIVPAAALIGEFLLNIESSASISTSADLLPRTRPIQNTALLSRIAFVVEVGAVLVFLWRTLHPKRGVLAINARAALPDDWLTRLRRLWWVLFVGLAAALVLLALVGYDFTARSLFARFSYTIGFLLVLFVLRAAALRWVQLERRREALEKLRRKREELREKRLAEIERRRIAGEDFKELESQGLEVAQDDVDFAALSSDVRDLVRMFTGLGALVGVILIWASVLPALGVLDGVKLWSQDIAVPSATGVEAVANPSAAVDSAPVVPGAEWITLGNLVAALIALFLTWRAVSDLPALLEIVLLRRLQMGSGERYAITTLLRYLLTVVGLVVAFDELGMSWSKLQWLVAGISVGLGFGLQEIFANFVSGITLLFERPIRVGDWVTLGDIEGVVSKIRIRATTIRDRDLKELIVPNREFITGRFINWTLSDPVSRVLMPVGIAYGSDTERAIQLLLECGRESSFSVAEPAPNVVFRRFGESSLDFELRVFVNGREIFPRVIHDLHMRVDAAFRRANIEISFPQRDLHIKTAIK